MTEGCGGSAVFVRCLGVNFAPNFSGNQFCVVFMGFASAFQSLDQFFDLFPCHFQNLPSCKASALKYVNICAMIAVAPIQFGGRPNNILANRAYVKPITSEHRKE
jgi:hypothetical protein